LVILHWLIGIIADGMSVVSFGMRQGVVSTNLLDSAQIVGESSILGQYGVSE
jgi:hypothetical protein